MTSFNRFLVRAKVLGKEVAFLDAELTQTYWDYFLLMIKSHPDLDEIDIKYYKDDREEVMERVKNEYLYE